MGFSTTKKNEVLNKLFGAADFTPPANYYLGLSTTQPADDGSGITEPSGGSYARVTIPNTDAYWNGASGGETSNEQDAEFAVATGAWGTVGWWVLMSLASGGVMHHWGVIQTPRVIASGDTLRFLAGDLVIRLRSE
jgi:hypothetical protein